MQNAGAQLAQVAHDAASSAARVIAAAAADAQSLRWESKSASDFVTQVDRDAESEIARVIRSTFPHAAIVGEELSPSIPVSPAGIIFVVDPLDGTTNFLHGYPQYAVSIAALVDGKLTAGVVLNAANADCFTATLGGGAYLNGRRISVSSIDEPARALIGTGFPFKWHHLLDRYAQQFVDISRQTSGIRRAGAAALDLADVACGRFDGFWELVLAPWDIAAGVLLIREAGGIVTDLDGRESAISHGPVVAGNPHIHAWLLGVLAGHALPDPK